MRSRFDGPLAGGQAAIGWATLALVLLSVLPFGGNEPIVWTMMAVFMLALFALQAALLFARPAAVALERTGPVALLYGAVVVWALVQVSVPVREAFAHPVWARAPEGASPRIGADPGQGAHMALRLATYGMIAWAMAAASLKAARAWAYLRAIALFSTALAVYGIAAGLTGVNPVLGEAAGRGGQFTATFVNRNSYATYAAFGMLANIACYLHMAGRGGGGERRRALRAFLENFFGGAWAFALGALLCGAAVAMTESRGGGGAAALGLVALLVAYGARRRAGQAALWGVLVAILAFVAVVLGSGTLDRLLADDAAGARPPVYAAILEHLSDRPWLGQGAGAFHDTFRAHLPLEAATAEWDMAHNSYLENAWELGLPAAALLYLALGLVLARLVRGLAVRKTDTGLPAVALAVMVTGAAHATVDFSLQMPACAALFAAILGIGWAQSFPRQERASMTRAEAVNDI